jgi:thiol-disulfide isomerase/thioredoxin
MLRGLQGGLVLVLAGAAAATPAQRLPEATASDLTEWFSASPKGHDKVVHLWASWCTPCIAELPALLTELRKRQERVEVVFLSLDSDAKASQAAALLRKNGGVPGVSARASSSSAQAAIRTFDPSWDGSLPTTYLVSREGHLAVAQRGITELEPLLSEVDRRDPIRNRSTARKGQP